MAVQVPGVCLTKRHLILFEMQICPTYMRAANIPAAASEFRTTIELGADGKVG